MHYYNFGFYYMKFKILVETSLPRLSIRVSVLPLRPVTFKNVVRTPQFLLHEGGAK